MLQLTNGAIKEYDKADVYHANTVTAMNAGGSLTNGTLTASSYQTFPSTQTIWWGNYPVYVCHDKTKKAIEILKALQADKQIECKSVPKFIELVEKIAGLL